MPMKRRFTAGSRSTASRPTLRASGVAQDMRKLGYAAFADLDFTPVTRNEGDSYARCAVRWG